MNITYIWTNLTLSLALKVRRVSTTSRFYGCFSLCGVPCHDSIQQVCLKVHCTGWSARYKPGNVEVKALQWSGPSGTLQHWQCYSTLGDMPSDGVELHSWEILETWNMVLLLLPNVLYLLSPEWNTKGFSGSVRASSKDSIRWMVSSSPRVRCRQCLNSSFLVSAIWIAREDGLGTPACTSSSLLAFIKRL